MSKKVVLTGIKPTGTVHLGNLLGAIQPALERAKNPDIQAFYFIADYHALTGVRSAEALRTQTYGVAATWLALGLDPETCLFYRQSDVPEVFELSWLLACFCPKGWMNKAHAYKASVQANQADGEEPDAGVNMGLYTYPVLMAADILLFDADEVPVGADQVQHVEIARDIAQRINHTYGDGTLHLPKASIDKHVALVPGTDGRKMSKSYDNILPLFDPTAKKLRKRVMRITTDSTPPEAPKDPETSLVFQLTRPMLSPSQAADLAQTYRAGISWGEAKQILFEHLDARLEEPRERYHALMQDTAAIDAQLRDGADRARAVARPVLQRVRDALGSTARPL